MAAVIFALCLAVLGRAISVEAAINHVLLLSVDGLHSSDLSQFVSANPHSHLAKLGRTGTMHCFSVTHQCASTGCWSDV